MTDRHQSSAFEDLPAEVKYLILNAVTNRRDLGRLCLVSKTFQLMATPQLYQNFCFSFDKVDCARKRRDPPSAIQRFRNMMGQGNNPGIQHIRTIHISLKQQAANSEWKTEFQLVQTLLHSHVKPNTLRSVRYVDRPVEIGISWRFEPQCNL